jgi:hypothetical protein
MRRLRYLAPLVAVCGLALMVSSAQALFHQWNFTEFFSNADGTVQFIELQCGNFNSENIATAGTIHSLSTGKMFTFPANLGSTTTANKFLFVATDGFELLPGAVTPDFATLTPLPANFFNPAGDTISLVVPPFGTVDSRSFTSLPTDGVMSRHFPSNTLADNSPTNFAGDMGMVDLTPPPMTTGDYNGDQTVNAADYTVWRNALGTTVTELGSGADGHADGVIDEQDYAFWKEKFGTVIPGAGNGGAAIFVPEPAMLSLTVAGLWALALATIRTRRAGVRR